MLDLVHACVCVCVHAHKFVHVCVCECVHVDASVLVCMRQCMRAQGSAQAHTRRSVCVRARGRDRACMYADVRIVGFLRARMHPLAFALHSC